MAEGKPVGTMYVELSMDSTKYTKAQKDILSGAEKNSADINKVFKTVGTQSDQMYDAMRKNITNALEAIKRSHLSSADEIRRAEESAAEKIRRIDVQQFGERKSLLDNLKSHWLATTAAIYAAQATIAQGWRLAEQAAQYEEQIAGLNGLAKQYGLTGEGAVKMAKDAVDGQLSMVEASKLAGKAMALGFNPSQMQEFLTVSERMTDVVGGEIPEAFAAMERAAATGRATGLVQYGIQVDLNKALDDYATAHGVAKDSLDAHTKMQVRAAAIMATAKEKTDLMGDATTSTADKMNTLKASVEDINLAIGQGLIRAAMGAAGSMQWLAAGALQAAGAVAKLQQWQATLSLRFERAKELKQTAADFFGAAEDLTGKAAENWKAATASLAELAGAMGKVNVATDDDTASTGKNTNTRKAHTAAVREETQAQKELSLATNWALQARILNQKEAGGWQYNPTETPTVPVKAEKNDYVEDTEAQAAAAARLTAQMKRQDQERALSSNNFFRGVRVGWEQMQEDQYTWAKGGQAMFEDFASSSRYVMSDVLFDGIKGDMDSFQDYWDAFFDSLLRTLTDTVSQMAVQWGINAAVSAGSSWGWWDSGLWEAAKDHPAIIHKGEMVVPADIAAKVRGESGSRGMNELSAVSPSGGHEWGSMEDNRTLNAMVQGTMRSWALNTAQGVSLYARGAIPTEAFMAGLFNPTRLVSAGIAGGIPAGVRDLVGLDQSNAWANWGQTIGGVLAAFATGYTGPAGVAAVGTGASLGAVIGDAIGDAFGGRNYESTRDAFESAYGYTEGRQRFADLVEGITALEKELGMVAGIDYDAMTAFGSRGDAGGRGISRDIDRDMGGAGAIGGERESRDYGGMAKTGVDYIPRDNITYTTHEGEAILTKEQARAWRSGRGGSGGGMVIEDLRIYIGDEEVTSRVKVVADGVIVERNRAGVNPTSRVYN